MQFNLRSHLGIFLHTSIIFSLVLLHIVLMCVSLSSLFSLIWILRGRKGKMGVFPSWMGQRELSFFWEARDNSSEKYINLYGQSLVTKLIVALGYKLTQYLFIGGEFWQIHHWIISSFYILHICKISKKLKINSYVINKFLNCKFL